MEEVVAVVVTAEVVAEGGEDMLLMLTKCEYVSLSCCVGGGEMVEKENFVNLRGLYRWGFKE